MNTMILTSKIGVESFKSLGLHKKHTHLVSFAQFNIEIPIQGAFPIIEHLVRRDIELMRNVTSAQDETNEVRQSPLNQLSSAHRISVSSSKCQVVKTTSARSVAT